ncbi:hypothetical protein ACFE04_006341 [Oxalis oulophora]
MSGKFIFLIVFILLVLSKPIFSNIHVRIINKLGNNRPMMIRCQSKDDDLGLITVPDGYQIEWKFSIDFLGRTLFFCDVKWDNSLGWHHFDAYSYQTDSDRCPEHCIWVISKDGLLFNFNQEYQSWELMPFLDN